MSDTKKEKIIGIDLGTSNSAASVLVGGKPTVIPSAEGASQYGKAFPSYVAFTEDGQQLVGEPARRQAVTNPENTISAIKRKMGTNEKVEMNYTEAIEFVIREGIMTEKENGIFACFMVYFQQRNSACNEIYSGLCNF